MQMKIINCLTTIHSVIHDYSVPVSQALLLCDLRGCKHQVSEELSVSLCSIAYSYQSIRVLGCDNEVNWGDGILLFKGNDLFIFEENFGYNFLFDYLLIDSLFLIILSLLQR
jgi:hypothetical protein